MTVLKNSKKKLIEPIKISFFFQTKKVAAGSSETMGTVYKTREGQFWEDRSTD
jgi:hypothetical protein